MNSKQFESVLSLPDRDRFFHFVSKICDWEEIWSIKTDDGWATVESEGRRCIPFWPHPDYAKYFASGDWQGYHPESISLENFINNWLPGMQKDSNYVAVFPNKDFQGTVVEAHKVLSEIEEKYQGVSQLDFYSFHFSCLHHVL